MSGSNRSDTAGCPACHAVGYHEVGCLFDSRSTTADEPVRNFGTDRRHPTGANDRRDGKDRRAWGTPHWRAWMSRDRKRSRTRRQSDRRGGE